MHYDLKRLRDLFQSPHSSVMIESIDARRRTLDARLGRARRKPSGKNIHDFRVATRRMLSVLDIAEAVVPENLTRKLRRGLRRRLGELSRIRDVHVQLGYCDQISADFPQLAGFHKFLVREERRLGRRVRKKLRSFDARKMNSRIDRVLEWVIGSLEPDSDDVLGERIAASVEDAWRRVLFLRARIDPKDTKSIHRMRLAFKRFRYMAEVTSECLPQLSPERLKAMHAYQNRMGAIQDLETLLATMMRFRKESGRTSLLVVENELRRRRQRLVGGFMQTVDELRFFWHEQRDAEREVV